MAEQSDADSKTEEPTEKRLADAVERGDVPVSRELPFLAALSAYLIIDLFVLPAKTSDLVAALLRFIDDPTGWRLERSRDVLTLASVIAFACARFLAPAIVLIMVFGVAASAFQNAPRIVPTRIMPDISRLSIWNGAARLFGPRGWTELAKSTLKLSAVALAITLILSSQRYLLVSAMFVDVVDLPGRLISLCASAIAAVMLALLAISAADLAWARIHWRRDQRMSRQELQDEIKQAEGDRLMKSRLKSLRLDRSRKRMLSAVPRATMVVVNPTHYAVAMRYVRAEGGAPLVLAKGVDLIALKIREIATEHNIPVIEDQPLARALYESAAVDTVIPPEFYRAVAEIVHLIQEKRSSWPLSRKRIN
jgi:flagellar biosynthetic protein FlhB